jgi:hypothetical protein
MLLRRRVSLTQSWLFGFAAISADQILESMVSTAGLQWVKLLLFDDCQERCTPSVAGLSAMRARFTGWPLSPESVTTHPR